MNPHQLRAPKLCRPQICWVLEVNFLIKTRDSGGLQLPSFAHIKVLFFFSIFHCAASVRRLYAVFRLAGCECVDSMGTARPPRVLSVRGLLSVHRSTLLPCWPPPPPSSSLLVYLLLLLLVFVTPLVPCLPAGRLLGRRLCSSRRCRLMGTHRDADRVSHSVEVA